MDPLTLGEFWEMSEQEKALVTENLALLTELAEQARVLTDTDTELDAVSTELAKTRATLARVSRLVHGGTGTFVRKQDVIDILRGVEG